MIVMERLGDIDHFEVYRKFEAFIKDKDMNRLQVNEVFDFLKTCRKQGRRGGKLLWTIRFAIYCEIWKCRNDYKYRESLEIRDLSNLWYDSMKPFLSRMFGSLKKHYRNLTSAILSDMALYKKGEQRFCTYSELKIEDTSKPRERPENYRKYHFGRFDEVILFIEKDTQFKRIKYLADLLGFTVECGKGQQSTANLEEFVEWMGEELEAGKTYLVFTITDYDQYGFSIRRSMEERARMLGLNAEFIHIAIKPEQIPEDDKEIKSYVLPVKKATDRKWAEQYGWTDKRGKKCGFEIEAIPAKRLREIIADAVYEYCDVNALYDYLLEKGIEGLPANVADWLADNDDRVSTKQDELNETQTKLDKKVEKLRKEFGIDKLQDKINKLREKLRDDFIDDCEEMLPKVDDREIPEDWLKRVIVEKKQSLYCPYADANDVFDDLKAKMTAFLKDKEDD